VQTLLMSECSNTELAPPPSLWGGNESEKYSDLTLQMAKLRAFHKCLIGNHKIFVYPRLHDALCENYKKRPWLLPDVLHRKALRDFMVERSPEFWRPCDWPRVYTIPNPFSRSPSWSRPSSLIPLRDINCYGYDIQVPVNPTAFKIRGHKTVVVCQNILAESDEGSIDEQLLALEPFKHEIVSILITGSRGVHAVFRLPKWIHNPYRVDWINAKRAQHEKDLRAPISEFVDAAGSLTDRLLREGFQPDTGAIVDHSRLTRLPGFKHGKTGRIAELIYLNPHASKENPTANPIILKRLSNLWSSDSIVSISVRGSSDASDKRKYLYEGGKKILQDEDGSFGFQSKECGVCGISVPVNVYTIDSKSSETPISPSKGKLNFLQDWTTYQRLKRQGIPERHTRMKFHMPMFSMATIFKWDDSQLANEWRNIISINPRHIGCGVREAVDDILAAWASRSRHEAIRLPDLTKLPGLDKNHTQALLESLANAGCPRPKVATRIVAETLIPKGRILPAQSKEGTLGLKSKEMLKRHGSRYRSAREGLIDVGLLEVTSRSYRPGGQTMQYRINWARLLIMCGYQESELIWQT